MYNYYIMSKDYYSILGVDKNATPDQIKSAFRKLAVKYHPDKQAGKSDAEKKVAEDKFKEINEAYETLSDPQKRQEYDNPNPFGSGMNGFRDANGNMHFSWSSGDAEFGPFSEFMNMFRRARNVDPNAPRPGQDIILSLRVEFMEAIRGCTKTVKLNIEDNEGDNRVLKPVTLEIKIPEGCPNGMRLRVAGKGNKGYNGGPTGDIYFQITVGEHETFVREGYDLLLEMKLPFETFVLGGTIKIPTLDGEKNYELKPNMNPGKILCFRGSGVHVVNTLNSNGDLRVLLSLEMPTNLTDKEIELLKQYRDERNKH